MYAAHTVSTTNPSIMFTYYLSLGTNLGNRTENIDCAIDLLTLSLIHISEPTRHNY